MRAKITALVLSGLVLSGAARGRTGFGCGRNGMWQNKQLRVTERIQPLRLTFEKKIARAIRFRCQFLADSEWRPIRARLRPLQKMTVQPANAVTASQFSCRTRLAG
jgi:hypothetical protein